ncbi:MAG: hypothetical protein MMC23_004722 [Stictis urceolatum]|nr:hypothetical protein [Stictis urceolata]
MDKAKAAIKDFTHRAGHHDTTVTEHVNPAVTQEKVTPTRHEEAQTVVDREVHQDHHHTTVQPVHDREVLPEKHSHQMASTENREFHHGDHSATKERLAAEAAQFKNTSTTGSTQHTASTAPTVGGEHVHHHVHETIQPVIQKETIQPNVVHTTVPVHETHHNESKHHATSALPAVSMADFKNQGGSLTGREDRTERWEGEPRTEGATGHGTHGTSGGLGSSTTHGTTGGLGSSTNTSSNAGPHGTMGNKMDPRVDSDLDGSRNIGGGRTHTGSGIGSGTGTGTGTGYDSQRTGLGSTGTTGTGTRGTDSTGYSGNSNAMSANQSNLDSAGQTKKPSLIDRLNPMKDTDGDGKKGMMD